MFTYIRRVLWIITIITTGVLVLYLPFWPVAAGMVLGGGPTFFLFRQGQAALKHLTLHTYQIINTINSLIWVIIQVGILLAILSGWMGDQIGFWSSGAMACGICNGYALSSIVVMRYEQQRIFLAAVVGEEFFASGDHTVRPASQLVQFGLGGVMFIGALGLLIFLLL